eukprot:10283535-Alexandrium_andersonii.AAC.1
MGPQRRARWYIVCFKTSEFELCGEARAPKFLDRMQSMIEQMCGGKILPLDAFLLVDDDPVLSSLGPAVGVSEAERPKKRAKVGQDKAKAVQVAGWETDHYEQYGMHGLAWPPDFAEDQGLWERIKHLPERQQQ